MVSAAGYSIASVCNAHAHDDGSKTKTKTIYYLLYIIITSWFQPLDILSQAFAMLMLKTMAQRQRLRKFIIYHIS